MTHQNKKFNIYYTKYLKYKKVYKYFFKLFIYFLGIFKTTFFFVMSLNYI